MSSVASAELSPAVAPVELDPRIAIMQSGAAPPEDRSQAFEDIYLENIVPVRNFVRYTLGNGHPDIEDVTQEVFAKVYTRIGQYQPDAGFKSWILQIARNASLDAAKYARRRMDRPLAESEEPISHAETVPEAAISSIGLRELITILQKHLTAGQLAILVLTAHGFNTRDVSEEYGQTNGAVKALQHRARKAGALVLANEL